MQDCLAGFLQYLMKSSQQMCWVWMYRPKCYLQLISVVQAICLGRVFGALIVTILSLILPKYTDAWLLYFGLFFVFLVIFSPRGFYRLS